MAFKKQWKEKDYIQYINKLIKSKDVDMINRSLSSSNLTLKIEAADAISILANMGVGQESSIIPLNELLNDDDNEIVMSAIYALGSLALKLEIGHYNTLPLLKYIMQYATSSITKEAATAVYDLILPHQMELC